MKLILQDPIGGQIPIDAESCPQVDERILIRGRKYIVSKVHHEIRSDENIHERLVTIVDVRLFTEEDMLRTR